MTHSPSTKIVHRGRIFPEIQWTPEEKARQKAEREAIFQRCKKVFDRLQSQPIENHYGWYVAIEPNSGDYFINADKEMARQKAKEKYPDVVTCMFCFNKTGTCGRI